MNQDLPTSLHQPFTIQSIREENYRTRTFTLDRPLPCTPGQFVMLWIPGSTEKPFSITYDDPFQLTIVAVGAFTKLAHTLVAGDRLWVRGPLGQGYKPHGKRIVLAAGGYGAVPLLFLARQAVAADMEVHACTGATNIDNVLFADEFKAAGAHVYIQQVRMNVERLLHDPATRPDGGVYACGPVKLLEAIHAICDRYGVPSQLSWEAHIRCGIGLCGSCEIVLPASQGDPDRTAWLVCRDGPVSFSK